MKVVKREFEQYKIIRNYTTFRSIVVPLLSSLMLKSSVITNMVLVLDSIVAKTIGKLFPPFKNGAILVYAQKRK